jgi:hypothetical protein
VTIRITAADGSRATNLAAVAWPPAGWVPFDLFVARQAWSISLNPRAFPGGALQTGADTAVTITRLRDGHTWTFQAGSQDGSLGISRDQIDFPLCLIFKPNDLGLVLNGDTYQVQVGGLRDGNGAQIDLGYSTAFFSSEVGDMSPPPSARPQRVMVHVDWQNQGSAVQHVDSDKVNDYIYVGNSSHPLTGLRLVVDTPEGVLPVAIQINEEPRLFGPGDWVHAADGGAIHQFRFVFGGLYHVLEFIGFYNGQWTREQFGPYTLDLGPAALERLATNIRF